MLYQFKNVTTNQLNLSIKNKTKQNKTQAIKQ